MTEYTKADFIGEPHQYWIDRASEKELEREHYQELADKARDERIEYLIKAGFNITRLRPLMPDESREG